MPPRQPQTSSSYADRLKQLIPAEFIAAYLAIFNLITSNIREDALICKILVFCAIILLIILPLYLYFVKGVNSVKEISGSCISLVIWVISIGKILEGTSWYQPVYASVAIILWTLVSPLLVSKK